MSEETTVVETAQPEATETPEQLTESTEVAEETKPETTEAEKVEMFKVKFNHEEKEITVDEAREYAQKGMNYDKVMEKLQALESNPSLKFVETQAKKNNMTTDEYLDAVAKEEVKNEIARIVEAEGVSETVAKKLYDATKLEEKTIADTKTAKEKEKQDAYLSDFVKKYPDVKEVPQEVWDRFAKGDISLVDAYANTTMQSELQELKDKLAKYESKEETDTKNTENAEASTGSVTGNGTAEHLYTREQVSNMTREEVNKNYNKVIESQKQWK